MKILVLNCGSSSLKYQLIDMDTKDAIGIGLMERIGLDGSVLTHRTASGDKKVIETPIPNHTEGIDVVLKTLVNSEYGAVKSLSEISAVGHRVVHGGEKFAKSALITDDVMQAIRDCIELAPLHNPPNIAGIEACQKLMPGVPQVAVFDTSFHQTMPDFAYMYGLTYDLYEKYKIRRYGFHGTSHKYVSQRAAAMLGKPADQLKIVCCHFGNGSSLSAVKGGKSVETSMGFTPLQGMLMGTRCGDLDPAIVTFIMRKENLTIDQVDDFLNKKCGVLGVSGVSSDFRDIEEEANKGNYRAKLALEMFAYEAKKYIGAYAAAMNGVDAVVFTAGIGENSYTMRSAICKDMTYLGIEIDEEKNKVRGEEVDVSKPGSKCSVLLIPTNEELTIALDTVELAK